MHTWTAHVLFFGCTHENCCCLQSAYTKTPFCRIHTAQKETHSVPLNAFFCVSQRQVCPLKAGTVCWLQGLIHFRKLSCQEFHSVAPWGRRLTFFFACWNCWGPEHKEFKKLSEAFVGSWFEMILSFSKYLNYSGRNQWRTNSGRKVEVKKKNLA